MAFNAFVVYETNAPNYVQGFGFNQAQADARAAEDSDWAAHQGLVMDIPDSAISGDFFFDIPNLAVTRVEVSAAGIIIENRNVLMTLARALEQQAGLAVWTAGELNAGATLTEQRLSIRSKSFARWVEMITRGIAVDNNMSNSSRHAILLREAMHPGRIWYWLHYATDPHPNEKLGLSWSTASSFANNNRGGWIWYSTTGPDADDASVRIPAANALIPNTRGYVSASQITTGASQVSLDAGDDFNWIHYLR